MSFNRISWFLVCFSYISLLNEFLSILYSVLLLLTASFYYVFLLLLVYRNIGEGNGTPLRYSCLENPMDGGAWWAPVLGVAKSRTQLSDFTLTFHFHALEMEMATHSSVSCLENPRDGGSLVGCCLWGCTESDTTEAT